MTLSNNMTECVHVTDVNTNPLCHPVLYKHLPRLYH